MNDPAPALPDVERLLKAAMKGEPPFIARRLLAFCIECTHDRTRAEDSFSEAIARTIGGKGWHRWVYDGEATPEESLLQHLKYQASDVVRKERKRAGTRRTVPIAPGEELEPEDPAGLPGERTPSSERLMTDMKRAEIVMRQLDEDALRMLYVEAESEEELEAKEVAEKLGWTVPQVYRARERVFYHRKAFLAEEARRARARKKGAA